MSLIRLLPSWLHAVADYTVGALLIGAALVVGGSGTAVATGVVVGATVLVVSLLTQYELGAFKVLPFKLHAAGDYLAAALLLVAPLALGFIDSDGGLATLYLVVGATVAAASLITDYAGETPEPAPVATPAAPPRRHNRPLVAEGRS